MHFTVDYKRLVKMIEIVRRKLPGAKKKDVGIRIYACAARVFVEANGVIAGEEALVFRDGGCNQNLEGFFNVLKSYGPKKNVTIEATDKNLKLFNSTFEVWCYWPNPKPPAKFIVGRVTDLGVLQYNEEPIPAMEPEVQLPLDEFPIKQRELNLVRNEVVGLVRRICSLPAVKPADLIGLAHALFALERLPKTTKGVAVELSIKIRFGAENEGTELGRSVIINENNFSLQSTHRDLLSKDNHSDVVYEVDNAGYRNISHDDEEAWLSVFQWFNDMKDWLKENAPDEIGFYLHDQSKPDVMGG
jgi:hypothetical protein